MLLPKKQKFRRQFRGRMKGNAQRGAELAFGEFGLKALDRAWVSSRQIEASRKAITHYTKRGGKLWIRIFPDKPVTMKGQGIRMGRGKGAVDHYVAVVTPGRILFEISGVTREQAKEAFRLAGHKMPIKTGFVAE
ncbi:MAG: 50S ribosomal protein L16 [bacterium]